MRRHVTEEQHIVWELDGGGYHFNDEAVLFEGRLYASPTALAKAKVRSRAKSVARILSAFIPFLVFMNNRS